MTERPSVPSLDRQRRAGRVRGPCDTGTRGCFFPGVCWAKTPRLAVGTRVAGERPEPTRGVPGAVGGCREVLGGGCALQHAPGPAGPLVPRAGSAGVPGAVFLGQPGDPGRGQ